MSEAAASQLTAKELHRLLDLLQEYISFDSAIIRTKISAPDSSGNPIHLDGQAFLAGFRDYLQSQTLESKNLISDLILVMEISTYVRCGGTKSIAYRLETGCRSINEDYFDVIANELCHGFDNDKTGQKRADTNDSLFQRIKQINPEDEARVSASISEIDGIILKLIRRLEEVSEDTLAARANSVEGNL